MQIITEFGIYFDNSVILVYRFPKDTAVDTREGIAQSSLDMGYE